MQNLAGVRECDPIVNEELLCAKIPVLRRAVATTEVTTSLYGCLGLYQFVRYWYYWEVNGPLPLAIAEELYQDPEGYRSIRVDGFSNNPAPASRAAWCKNGQFVIPLKYRPLDKQLLKMANRLNFVFANNPVESGAAMCVCTYHIDTQAGLRLFADTIVRHGLC